MKNVGNSPAVSVNIINARVILGFGPFDAIAEQKIMLTTKRGNDQPFVFANPSFGYMLFPGEEFFYEVTFGISREQMKQYETKMIKLYGRDKGTLTAKTITPAIVDYVSYRFSFDKSVHKTGFIAEVFRVDPRHPNARFSFNPEAGDIPLNLLKLQMSEFGSYAD